MKNKIIAFFRQLFCWHDFQPVETLDNGWVMGCKKGCGCLRSKLVDGGV